MYHFISNTDEVVEFTQDEAQAVPYARDVFDTYPYDKKLDFPFATTAQLLLMRDAIRAKGPSGSFLPKKEHIQFGSERLPLPPFMGLIWSEPLETFLYSLDRNEIADLIQIANSTCMWTLRHTMIRMMFIRIIMNDAKLEEFFPSPSLHLMEIMLTIYYTEITSVSRSGYCDPHSNNGWD